MQISRIGSLIASHLVLAVSLLLQPHTEAGELEMTSQEPTVSKLPAVGIPVKRLISSGQTHGYLFNLDIGQFLHLEIEQMSVDVKVILYGPGDVLVYKIDRSSRGVEMIYFLASGAGDHRLEIEPFDQPDAGEYELSVIGLREPSGRDRTLAAAQMVTSEGDKLGKNRSLESLQQASQKYKEALGLWKQSDDRLSEADAHRELAMIFHYLGSYERSIEEHNLALNQYRDLGDRRRIAAILNEIGHSYFRMGKNREALEFYNQAHDLFREIGDWKSEIDLLINMGRIHSLLGDKQRRVDLLSEGLEKARSRKERKAEADILEDFGNANDDMNQPDRAIEFYNQALALKREIGDRRGEASILNNLGDVYRNLGEPDKAIEQFSRAISIWRSIGDQREEAIPLGNIAIVYSIKGDYQRARDYFTQSLELSRALNNREAMAVNLAYLGDIHDVLGDPDKAHESYDQARGYFHELGIRAGVASMMLAMSRIDRDMGEVTKSLGGILDALQIQRELKNSGGIAGALNSLAAIYGRLGERQKALDSMNEALDIYRSIGFINKVAETLNNLGAAYRDLGAADDALGYYDEALALFRKGQVRNGEANVLSAKGVIFRDQGEYQKALELQEEALRIWKAIGNRGGEINALGNIGAVYFLDLNDKPKGLNYYRQALSIALETKNLSGELNAMRWIGSINISSGEYEEGLKGLERALTLARTIGDRDYEATILYAIGMAHRDLGELSQARSQVEAAIGILESLRSKVISPELRGSIFSKAHQKYTGYIDLLMRLHAREGSEGLDALALEVSERSRARSLLDLLAESQARIRVGVDADLVARQQDLINRINARDGMLRKSSGRDRSQKERLEKEVDGLVQELRQIEVTIRRESPGYAALTQPEPVSIEEIQRTLVDSESMLLEFSLGEERSYLWAITTEKIISHKLPGRAKIEQTSRKVYDLMTARGRKLEGETISAYERRIARADIEFPKAALELSRMLLGPVELQTKRLVIVADGVLHYIPFSALSDPRKSGYHPLIENFEIVNLPSASTLSVMRKELSGRSPAPKMVAILADPIFDASDKRVVEGKVVETGGKRNSQAGANLSQLLVMRSLDETGIAEAGRPYPPLQWSFKEAEAISKLVPKEELRLMTGFNATHEAVTDPAMSEYRIVHFATHGLINSRHPELSGMLLTMVDPEGRPRPNGILRLGEVYNLRLPAELSVLSACQTALGRDISGEGLVGLTRGFMYAGAARVVASLWQVNDRATSELMRTFYSGMLGREKLRPAAALREAQLKMLRSPRRRSPFYWAAFTLQGEWK